MQHNTSTRRRLLKAVGAGGLAWMARRCLLPAALASEGGNRMDPESSLVRPTPQQLAWQEAELTMFLHFGMNTFTDREWGEGDEDPRLFDPARLDARQWVRVAKEAGFGYMVLTAKHHDGFCLWPSRYTDHSVKSSPWRGGKGDVVREFAEACHAARMKMGLYLSPWDRHEPCYGDSPRYNEHFRSQLTELLTGYGPVAEMWFDGACGEGPNGKRQEYDWASYYAVIRKLQPEALIAICGPDVRWAGNEDGVARETEWSVQPAPAGSLSARDGKAWYPAECDVSIRPGWFWHQHEDDKVKSLAHLMDIYYKSVGRNSVLLLNVPPNRDGLIAEPDVRRLQELRAYVDHAFAEDLARGKRASASSAGRGRRASYAVDGKPKTCWSPGAGGGTPWLEVDLGHPATFNVTLAQELIAEGQRVEEYRIEAWDGAAWKPVVQGTTIGHRKLDRVPATTASKVRLTLAKAQAAPLIRTFGLYHVPPIEGSGLGHGAP